MSVISEQPPVKGPDTAPAPKPRLRGWLHAGMTPAVFFAGLALATFAPTLPGRVGGAVYLCCALLLFGWSATYHRGNWEPSTSAIFRRVDHSNIFIFIAGTYTPLCLTLLDGTSQVLLLTLIWAIAVLGVIFRVVWLKAPRWLYSMMYVAMGWVAVWWLPAMWAAGGAAVVTLILVGGIVYSLGALTYASKWPNPSPGWFGFHEVFHATTVIAAICHYVAIALATFGAS